MDNSFGETTRFRISFITVNASLTSIFNIPVMTSKIKGKYLDKNIIGFKAGKKLYGLFKNGELKSRRPFKHQVSFMVQNKDRISKVRVFNTGKVGIPGCVKKDFSDAIFAINRVIDKIKEIQSNSKDKFCSVNSLRFKSIESYTVKGNTSFKRIMFIDLINFKKFIDSGEIGETSDFDKDKYSGLKLKLGNVKSIVFSTGSLSFTGCNFDDIDNAMSTAGTLISNYILSVSDNMLYCKIKIKNEIPDIYICAKYIEESKILNMAYDENINIDLSVFEEGLHDKFDVEYKDEDCLILENEDVIIKIYDRGTILIKSIENRFALSEYFNVLCTFIGGRPSINQ